MTNRAVKIGGLITIAASLLASGGCDTAQAPAAGNAPSALAADAPAANAEKSPAGAAVVVDMALPATAPQNITFDNIKFPLEKNADYQRSLLTPEIEKLNGRPVRLRGFILPSFQQSGLTQFVLVRDNMECCFGPGAALYDCVVVEMKPGKSTDFTVRPVAVDGTFEIRDFLDPDGKPLAIYHLDGDAVRF